MRRLLLFSIMLLPPALLLFVLRRPAPPAEYDLAVFNTLGRLTLWETPRDRSDAIAREVMAKLQQLHNTLNIYDPGSEASRLNRMPPGEYFECPEKLWEILLAAREAYQLTGGAFDITVGPLMKLWGFHRKRDSLPSQQEIQTALAGTGFDKLLFDEKNHRVAFSCPGMAVDFGGLAKGFALDSIRPLIEQQGCRSYMLNLGGNIYCSAEPPPGRKPFFRIGIRDPKNPEKIYRTLALRDRYISTSANYERALQIGEKKIGHLLDPKTGYPAEVCTSVTVVTTRGSWSDAFSTAVFVAGPELADRLSRQLPGTEFFLLP